MLTRRQFLGAAAAAAGAPFPMRRALADDADLVLRLVAEPGTAALWPGPQTGVLRYQVTVLHGRPDAVTPSTGAFGPTLELRQGERVRIYYHNRMRQHSIVHWHGLLVPDEADGHPRHAVGENGQYIYEFTVRNPAGTYLYHPHAHGMTGAHVYFGLAGMLIVRDAAEKERGLPDREHELSLAIQDRRVDSGNQLVFRGGMMDRMQGVLGEQVLVNGMPDAAFSVARRPYRLRLANVSNARIYKLAWSDGRPMHVIAADNGLLASTEGPKTVPYLTLAPFERVELLEDFGERAVQSEVSLISREFQMGRGMMSRMMGGAMQGQPLPVARFSVGSQARVHGGSLALPSLEEPSGPSEAQLRTQLAFRHMQGFLNGRSFDMLAFAEDERVPLGKPVIWTFTNDGPGMAMPHPMHLHGVRFRILARKGGGGADDLNEGIVSAGFKDTFLIRAGETVKIAFAPTEPGLFMYHCHNLEHEDAGMMRNFFVG